MCDVQKKKKNGLCVVSNSQVHTFLFWFPMWHISISYHCCSIFVKMISLIMKTNAIICLFVLIYLLLLGYWCLLVLVFYWKRNHMLARCVSKK